MGPNSRPDSRDALFVLLEAFLPLKKTGPTPGLGESNAKYGENGHILSLLKFLMLYYVLSSDPI